MKDKWNSFINWCSYDGVQWLKIVTIIVLLAAALFIYAVVQTTTKARKLPKPSAIVQTPDGKKFAVVIIDGCEYLAFMTGNGTLGYTHKGNCKNH